MADQQIRSRFVPIVLNWVKAQGRDPSPLLRQFALHKRVLAERDVELPLSTVRDLPMAAAALLGDPLLGVNIATRSPPILYGMMELSSRAAPTLRDSAQLICRHATALNPPLLFAYEETRDEGCIDEHLPGEPLCLSRHGNEFVVALLVRGIRDTLHNEAWAPTRVWLAHPAPPEAAALPRYFGTTRIGFAQGSNGLALAAGELDTRLLSADPEIVRVVGEEVERAAAKSSDALLGGIRRQIHLKLRRGPVQLKDVAAGLNTTPRTLQRWLTARKLHFGALVDEVRFELARHYLAQPGHKLAAVASRLGFSEANAFVRAFKRWSGTTPARFRANAVGHAPPVAR